MKFLLLVVFCVVVWRIWSKKSSRPQQPLPLSPAPERMVVCLHCGVHLPESDSLPDGQDHYCGEAHRRAGPAAEQR